MKRREIFSKIWRTIPQQLSGKNIVIRGAGPAGLHLAYFLRDKNFTVTVCDPAANGGIRIPLVHACHTRGSGSPLWRVAKEYSREWYGELLRRREVIEKDGRFVIALRPYLRRLRQRLIEKGVIFTTQKVLAERDLNITATGAAAKTNFIFGGVSTIQGFESYWRDGRRRIGYIHPRKSVPDATSGRALFSAYRLVTRDKLPIVGFMPNHSVNSYDLLRHKVLRDEPVVNAQEFAFTGFGFHAMTYTPFLAQAVATHFAGERVNSENLISALTPARFLPRTA